MSRKLTATDYERIYQAGKARAKIERKLLMLLFEGFSSIAIDKYNYDLVSLLNRKCSLKTYARLAGADTNQEYIESSHEIKKYFRALLVLDKLVLRGLVERKINFVSSHSPEDGFKNLEGELQATEARSIFWLARGLHKPFSQSFKYNDHLIGPNMPPDEKFTLAEVEYHLTNKGFDVALKFQEHLDNEAQFNQQKKLTEEAVKASKSSASTAKYALWAAGFIALGSLGNLAFLIGEHFFEVRSHCTSQISPP